MTEERVLRWIINAVTDVLTGKAKKAAKRLWLVLYDLNMQCRKEHGMVDGCDSCDMCAAMCQADFALSDTEWLDEEFPKKDWRL